ILAVVLLAPPAAWAEPPRADAHGDARPEGALARLGTVRLRHGRSIDVMRFSADGKRLATMDDNDLFVWDRVTGRPLLALRRGSDPILYRSLGLSADGKTVAAVDWKGRLHAWDVASGKERVHALEIPDGKELSRPVFSADRNVLAVLVYSEREDGLRTTAVYDAVSGRPLPNWKSRCLGSPQALSADGTRLAVREGGDAFRVWDTATGKELARLEKSTLVD